MTIKNRSIINLYSPIANRPGYTGVQFRNVVSLWFKTLQVFLIVQTIYTHVLSDPFLSALIIDLLSL